MRTCRRWRVCSHAAFRAAALRATVSVLAASAVLATSAAWGFGAALRAQVQLHPQAQEAISKLRSPFCPGLMLEVCPTLNAQALRDSIDDGARGGVSADSLIESVVAAYGEEYRAFPKRRGTGLLAWVVPPGGLLVGLGLVLLALRRLRGPTPASGAAEDDVLTDDEEARLTAAMAEFEAAEEEELL